MLNKDWVQKKISELHLRPTRDNGQNFMINEQPLQEIISVAAVVAGENVLEIGPGLGALTEKLLHVGAVVTAIEFDEKLAQFLQRAIPKKFPLTIISGDVVRVADYKFLSALGQYKVVANIPYQITGEIIRLFTETNFPPTSLTLLVQKEVGERLAAAPPKMTLASTILQWRAAVKLVAVVSKQNFWPVPAVDSAIIKIDPQQGARQQHKISPAAEKQLFSLIKRGFHHPRKQIGNNLSVGTTDPARQKFDFSRRAETLTFTEWINIRKILSTPHN